MQGKHFFVDVIDTGAGNVPQLGCGKECRNKTGAGR